jgi:hypothetical protein
MLAGVFTGLSALAGWSQPTPAPTTGDLACKTEAQVDPADTVAGVPDAEGFRSLFDGSFKGWFQSCVTGHSGRNPVRGAIFRIGTADGKPAIYSTQRVDAGGVLMTNKKFGNYEIRFQFWPDWGNWGGVLNRTPMTGRCYLTTLRYAAGASMGGVWGESGFTGRQWSPFSYYIDEQSISVPGITTGGDLNNWTLITQKLKATTEPDLPCPTTGCTQADWRALWDFGGWNDIRIQFYGGRVSSDSTVSMKAWFKKPASDLWVPFIQDTTLLQIIPDNPIGFLVAGDGSFNGPKGTWYRDIRWRPLDDRGNLPSPLPTAVLERKTVSPFTVTAYGISGRSGSDYSIQVMDLEGRLLEAFSGRAGAIGHAFATQARGLLFLKLRTSSGAETRRILRPF